MSARNRMFVEVIFIYSGLYAKAKTPFRARLDNIFLCVLASRIFDMAQAVKLGRSCAYNPPTRTQWEHR